MTYKIILSTKETIPVDADEVQKLLDNVSGKNLIRLRAGIINPSYFVALVEDKERKAEHYDKYKYEIREGTVDSTPIALKDIFSNTKLLN